VKTLQKETKQDLSKEVGIEAVAQLRAMADEIRTNSAASRAVMLCSIETLLAGADILSCDCIAALQAERDVMHGGMQSQHLEADSGEDEGAPIPALSFKECESLVVAIEEMLNGWLPDKQRAVVQYVRERLPEKEAKWELETERDAARDDLINYLHNQREFEEETVIYRATLAAVKAGNGIVEFKKTG